MEKGKLIGRIFGVVLVLVVVGTMLVPAYAGDAATRNVEEASADDTACIGISKVNTPSAFDGTRTVVSPPVEDVTESKGTGSKTVVSAPVEDVTESRGTGSKTVVNAPVKDVTESKGTGSKTVVSAPVEDVTEPEKLESSSYDVNAAVNYANAWCNGRNPSYNDYSSVGGDCANFVSQCLIAGGLDLSICGTCSWVDSNGCLPRCDDLHIYLANYLGVQYEMRSRSEVEPLWFLPGDVAIFGDDSDHWRHAVFCISGDETHWARCAAHTQDVCNTLISTFFAAEPSWTHCYYYHVSGQTSADAWIYDLQIQDAVDSDSDGYYESFSLCTDADTDAASLDVYEYISASSGEVWSTSCWTIYGSEWDWACVPFDMSEFSISSPTTVTLTVDLYNCDTSEYYDTDSINVPVDYEPAVQPPTVETIPQPV